METYYMVSIKGGDLALSKSLSGEVCFLPWEFGQTIYFKSKEDAESACELFKNYVKLIVEKVQGEIRDEFCVQNKAVEASIKSS